MRREIGDGLRYRILKRDSFRCRYCGAHGSETELQVDHVQPVSAGGTNAPQNLVTACRGCNSGKGADEPEMFECSPSEMFSVALPAALDMFLENPGDYADYRMWRDLYEDECARLGVTGVLPQDSQDRITVIADSLRRRVWAHWGPQGLGSQSCYGAPPPYINADRFSLLCESGAACAEAA